MLLRKILQNSQKTSVSEPLFNTFAGLELATVLKTSSDAGTFI